MSAPFGNGGAADQYTVSARIADLVTEVSGETPARAFLALEKSEAENRA